MTQSKYQVVIMTASTPDEAERIAAALVEQKLAACVNIVPSCRSVYRWKGDVVKENEALMFAKAKREDFETIARKVAELHSYDVPEVIALDLESLSESYRQFLIEVLGG